MDAPELHIAVCLRFGEAVRLAEAKWQCPSPCDKWNAGDVLEHVIGFHDVLLLRPLGLKPDRPRDDPRRRWELAFDRIQQALATRDVLQRIVQVPAVGTNPPASFDVGKLLPRLTRDVLVHTWDLAAAVGADAQLNQQWCQIFLDRLPADPDALSASGMFAAPVAIDDDADAQARLLARLGRNPT